MLPRNRVQTGMRYLVLVKHSQPEIKPNIPARDWRLSDEGRRRCASLAERLHVYCPATIVTSREPKAVETGTLLAIALGTTAQQTDDLHEHDRHATGFLSVGQFEAAVEAFFAHPDELRFGSETADQSHARFRAAVEREVAAAPDNVIIVAHGTVISLFVSRCAGIAPFPLWKRLGLPSYVVLALPTYELAEIVNTVQ